MNATGEIFTSFMKLKKSLNLGKNNWFQQIPSVLKNFLHLGSNCMSHVGDYDLCVERKAFFPLTAKCEPKCLLCGMIVLVRCGCSVMSCFAVSNKFSSSQSLQLSIIYYLGYCCIYGLCISTYNIVDRWSPIKMNFHPPKTLPMY